MIYTRLGLAIIVTGVGVAIEQELALTGGGPVGRSCLLVPGSIAWDECDCNGQLAQTITTVSPSSTFPQPETNSQAKPCGSTSIVADVQVSVARCVPVIDQRGYAPTCDALLRSALTVEADRFATYKAVTCALADLYEDYVITDYTVGSVIAVGPEGDCVGITLTYQFAVTNICCG